ncbi:hypothetical protein K9O30_01660 [Clostridium bowmanii]|uniref:hypothetical protein n=1 Tax=Clostridium bowmanii TaxID=132925 RepID=UPI001C0E70FC|nr:hypothetical protein [Clostridium bowmanii]MBU3190324.1 hypothetical protein [Clostridium bowmanii]MCA1072464.1 hypothetical protein [Clostridium bowmanii]
MANKKIFMGLSTVAIAAIMAASVSSSVYAADGDLYKGNTNLGGIGHVLLTSKSTIFDMITKLDTYGYEVTGNIYDAAKVNAIFEANPTASLATIQASVKADLEIESPVPVVVAELKVSSVSAINATQVNVVFSAALDASDAIIHGQYSLNGVAPTAAVLSDDKMSVKLTFATAEATSKVFTIQPIKSDADANVSSEIYTKVYTYKDTVKPVIASVTSVTAGTTANTVIIKASEPIAAGSTLKIDGVSTAITFVGDTATITGLSLDATKAHVVEVLNLTDLAATPNVTTYTTNTFSATVDAVKPTATIAAQGDKNILVAFSKSMNPTSVTSALTNGVVKDESLGSIGSSTAVVVANTDNKQFVIGVTDTLYATLTSRTLNVILPATLADSLGNTMAVTSKTVSLSKDTVKPVATGFSVVKDATGKVTDLVVNFNEGLAAASSTGDIANPTIIDADGVLVSSFVGGLTSDIVVAGDKKVTYSVTTPAKVYGSYAFSFANALVSDQAETANDSIAFAYNNDFGVPDAGTGTFDLVSAVQTTPTSNIILVDFGVEVKGGNVANSATSLSSYTLNGKALPAGTTITLDSTKKIARITLPDDGMATADINAIFTVSGVKSATDLNVTPYLGTVIVVDNTAPVLQSAKVLDNQNIILTYSEDMKSISAANVGEEFEIKQGTTTFTLLDAELKATNLSGVNNQIKLTVVKTTGAIAPASVISPVLSNATGSALGATTGTYTGVVNKTFKVRVATVNVATPKVAATWEISTDNGTTWAAAGTDTSLGDGLTLGSFSAGSADSVAGDTFTIVANAATTTTPVSLDLTKDITIKALVPVSNVDMKDASSTNNGQKASASAMAVVK